MDYIRELKNILTRLYTRTYAAFHPIEKKILFDSFGGKQYSDNPRAICERMHEIFPDYDLVWVNNDIADKYQIIPSYINLKKRTKRSFYQQLATSFCYVTNENINNNIAKRKKQLFVQTWHGDIGIKKVVYDAIPNGKLAYKVIDSSVDDICIAGSDLGESTYRTAFKYKGEVLKVGTPRNDRVISMCNKEKDLIRHRIGIKENKKILIYAPTYRDNLLNTKQESLLDITSTLDSLEKKGGEWICLVRAHSAASGIVFLHDERIVDVTDYPDMSDLLAISDILITDYSSCAGDFILKGKPTILIMFDSEEYKKACREFVFDPAKAGFLVANTQEELNQIINNNDDDSFRKNCESIIEKFNIVMNDDSSKIICERINDYYMNTFNQ